jgi:LuxR family maltose regulon positive regulatory protein
LLQEVPPMSPLLTAKQTVPPVRAALVDRRRLTDRLNAGLAGRLILVAAPPGAGKSTLLSSWLRGADRPAMPAAWLSLDEGDNDPARFFLYLTAALEQVLPGAGEGARALLGAPRPAPPAALMAALLSGLERPQRPFLLVLDDFHSLTAPGLIEAVALLVEHLPPGAHLVIGSRSEPPLPLARLRVRGELTELRGADLRFTPAEAAAFLAGGMGLQLPEALVETLEARTEGWVAGLQLAGLSLRGRPDPAAAVAAFSGTHRYVLDYLAAEVLERQRPEVRAFLLATAVLEQLTGPLCDALTGRHDGPPLDGAEGLSVTFRPQHMAVL